MLAAFCYEKMLKNVIVQRKLSVLVGVGVCGCKGRWCLGQHPRVMMKDFHACPGNFSLFKSTCDNMLSEIQVCKTNLKCAIICHPCLSFSKQFLAGFHIFSALG